MDIKAFRSIVNDVLKEHGFSKKRGGFLKEGAEIICSVGLQKSGFSNSYYINVGFIIKDLHPDLTEPKYTDGDIRCRFSFNINGSETDVLDLDEIPEIDPDSINNSLKLNIKKYINVAFESNLRELLIRYPVLLYQTTLKAKEYFGIEN